MLVNIEQAIVAEAPAPVIWELITDWEHQGDWMLEARGFVVTTAHRTGVGVEAEASISIAGITTRDRVRVAAWEPPYRLVIEHLGWVSGEGEILLTPLGQGRTHIFWREELRPPWGLLGAAGMLPVRPVMARVFARDLRILAGMARAVAAAQG